MSPRLWRAALVPLRSVVSPDASLREAGAAPAPLVAASLLALLTALGSLAIPRLLALLASVLAFGASPLIGAHRAVLGGGLTRYILADRLAPPVPYLLAALIAFAVAAPALAGRGVRSGAVLAVIAAGASPLLVQRAGELAVVWLAPPDGLEAGDVAGLPARFNVGLAGLLASAGTPASGWRSVLAEAANGIGVWVVLLWGWGLARLGRGPRGGAPGAADTIPWCLLAAAAYGAGYALHAALFPVLLMLVMGAP